MNDLWCARCLGAELVSFKSGSILLPCGKRKKATAFPVLDRLAAGHKRDGWDHSGSKTYNREIQRPIVEACMLQRSKARVFKHPKGVWSGWNCSIP